MSNEVANKPAIGRQSHLPLSKAFQISMNSLKIRFWRSMVTAAGIFLGIAFLATVLTQSLMQWPIAEEVSPGMVKIDGLINGPGEFVMWKTVPIDEGVKAGIPENIIKRTANGDGTFNLTAVAQGIYDAKRADKNLARVLNEWKTLKTVKPAFYDSSDGDRDISVGEAKKAGVPLAIARHLAMDSNTFKAILEAIALPCEQ